MSGLGWLEGIQAQYKGVQSMYGGVMKARALAALGSMRAHPWITAGIGVAAVGTVLRPRSRVGGGVRGAAFYGTLGGIGGAAAGYLRGNKGFLGLEGMARGAKWGVRGAIAGAAFGVIRGWHKASMRSNKGYNRFPVL